MKGLKIYQHLFCYLFVTSILIGVSSCSAVEKLRIEKVLIEGRENPLGINTLTPSFSWKLRSEGHNVMQTAYRIIVSTNADISKQSDILWDSEWVSTDQSIYNTYNGQELQPGTAYFTRIEVKDNQGDVAESIVQSFHTGLLAESDWEDAQWITKEKLPDSLVSPLPLSS